MIRSNEDQVIAHLEQQRAAVPGRVDAVLLAAGRDALQRARSESPVDSGALRDAWTLDAEPGLVVVENDLRYAGYALPELHIEDVVDVAGTSEQLGRLLED